ncbi:hypothetical protein [Clostridium sp.]
MSVLLIIGLFYLTTIIASIVLFIYVLQKRLKERKIEKEKHEKYKDY